MISDFIVIDNAFSDPDTIRAGLLSMEYYSNEEQSLPGVRCAVDNNKPLGFWRGFRTDDLARQYPNKTKHIVEPLFTKIFSGYNISTDFLIYGHIAPAFLNKILPDKSKWHTDSIEASFAGVVYLNKHPVKNSGTSLKLNNKVIEIENVYNRLVFYNARVLHSPGVCFGESHTDSRLTMTIFTNELIIKSAEKYEALY